MDLLKKMERLLIRPKLKTLQIICTNMKSRKQNPMMRTWWSFMLLKLMISNVKKVS